MAAGTSSRFVPLSLEKPKGLLEVNDEHAAEVFREGQKTDGWVGARREIYDKMIHKDVRDTYIAQMDLIVKRIYQINKPEVRHFTLTPVNNPK